MMTTEQIVAEISRLSEDVLVATNEGTHGEPPEWNSWRTYERLDGVLYTVGDRDSGAGYARHIGHKSAAERRAKIAALQSQIQRSESEERSRQRHRDSLLRGWDGYQFIGFDEGRRRAGVTA